MKEKTFDEIYGSVSPERRECLRQFREEHPYTHRVLNGDPWDYVACGRGPEALLLLGGGGSKGNSNADTIHLLEGRMRIISPSYPPAVSRMDQICDGLAAVLDAEGVEQAHVCGHSLGSGVAHALVRRHPERIGKVILGSFGLYSSQRTRRLVRSMGLMEHLPYAFTSSLFKTRLRRLTEGLDPEDSAFLRATFDEMFDVAYDRRSFSVQMHLLFDLFQRAAEHRTYEPVMRPGQVLLLLAADDRGFKPEEREALIASYPAASVILFDRGGHLMQLTRRSEYEEAIERFLDPGTPGDAAARSNLRGASDPS